MPKVKKHNMVTISTHVTWKDGKKYTTKSQCTSTRYRELLRKIRNKKTEHYCDYVPMESLPDVTTQADISISAPTEQPVEGPSTSATSKYKQRKIIEYMAWKDLHSELLKHRIAGFSPGKHSCCLCNCDLTEVIWCPDCGPFSVYCRDCDTKIHNVVLFHQSFKWQQENQTYSYLPRTAALTSEIDHDCDTMYMKKLTVFDNLGRVHNVVVKFCRCQAESATLVRLGLWPSTPSSPTVAFTITFMELCRAVQLEGQLSIQRFCKALELQQTMMPRPSGANLYRSICDALAEFRCHQVSCMETAKSPEALGKKCPVCSQNPQKSIISLDANFGLVHKRHSGTGPGQQYTRMDGVFCDEHEVKQFIEGHSPANSAREATVTSDCSDFQAGSILRSKNKTSKLDIKGVFGSVCQHGFPQLFLNMEHGERFCYPAFVLNKIAQNLGLTGEQRLTVMYDVACSLERHLKKNAQTYGPLSDKFQLVVPIFHSYAHNLKCQLTYGQRYTEGTGMVDGEGMERLWSYLRRFAVMSKEMTLPNRQDLLSCGLNAYANRNLFSLVARLAAQRKKCRDSESAAMQMIRNACSDEAEAARSLLQLKNTTINSEGVSLITQARKLAAERMHLQGLMKKYADGQKVVTRVIKKLQDNTKKLKSICTSLQGSQSVTFADLANMESVLYQNQNMNTNQVSAAQASAQLARSREQAARISADVQAYRQWIVASNITISAEIEATSAETSSYSNGLCHLLHMSQISLNMEAKNLVETFGPELFNHVDSQVLPETSEVHDVACDTTDTDFSSDSDGDD